MIIHLKTVCAEIIGSIPNAEYTVDPGVTAKQALCLCLESQGMNVPEDDQLSGLLYLVNNRLATADTTLNAGDRLMVLRPARAG